MSHVVKPGEERESMKAFSKKSIAVALIAIALVATTVGAAVLYNLNKTVPATVTINQPPPVEAILYADLTGTPFTGTLNFGTHEVSGVPQTAIYFNANQIAPSSVVVVANGLPTGAGFNYIVGTPASTGYCPIALWLTGVTPGTHGFTITVTGNS